MLRPWTRYLLYVCTLPSDAIAWTAVLLLRALWGSALGWRDGALVVVLRADSWPVRTWYRGWGGTTLAHGILIAMDRPDVVFHEQQHVRQSEAAGLCALVMGVGLAIAGQVVAGVVLWAALPWFVYGAAMLAAAARGEAPYRHNVLEDAAYDATDEHGPR